MRISLLCAAGASSTFAALHLRREAAARKMAVDISVSTVSDELTECELSDVILVGSHLAEEYDRIQRSVPTARVVLLGSTIRDRAQAAEILDLIAAQDNTAQGARAPQSEGQKQ
ncbi:MAG: hypothetical protein ACTJHU_07895 [Mycetocola sp.]